MASPTSSLPATDQHLDVRFFGHGDVRVGGVAVKFAKRTTTLAMLALVALQRGTAISRESLAFTLFPEADEATALAELRRYLYLANKALPKTSGETWLIVDPESVRWNAAANASIDVISFERLAANAETHSQAIELYSGDLLEDIYDDWIVAERERLRTSYLALLSESIARYRAERQFNAALACAARLLAADPWREDALRALVAARYESGDTAGALAEYERFAKRLRDELAIAPMPETLAVRQSILRNEAVPGSLDIAPSRAPSSDRRKTAILPFVGRRHELSALHTLWGRAARGAGAFVLLKGEAGIGKTRLTAELARTVQAEGGRVFVGTTAAPESSPYQAIVEAFRSGLPLLLARPPSAARRAALGRVVPELRDPDAPDVALPEQTADRETTRIYDAFAHAVRQLATPRPLLLVLEDLHWAGPATAEAIGAIVKELTRAPVLVLATCREEEIPADHSVRTLLRSLRAFQNVEELVLERLTEGDVAEFVTRVDGLRDRGDGLARDLYAQSEGNPLFLSEAVSDVLERCGQRDVVPAGSLPVLAARIAQLGEGARSVAEIAAIAGPGCSVALLREVSNLPVATIARGFDELLDRRILREAGARASYDYVFTHHLIAQAVYDQIEPVFRSQRHSRIARLLEAEYRSSPTTSVREIARHYERAGEGAQAAHWYMTAALAAATVHAYADAIEFAGSALACSPSDDVRRAALDIREKAHGRRGDRAGQRNDIDELERLAGDDSRRHFDVLMRQILLARHLGDSDEEGRLIDQLQIVAQSLGADAGAQGLAQQATYAGLRSRPADGIAPAKAALAIYEQLCDLRGQLECLYLLVDFTANIGDLESSRIYLDAMRLRAADLADQVVEARALAVAAQAALLRQNYRDCFDLTVQGLALHVLTNDVEAEASSRGRLAVSAAWLGEFETALREFERALDTYESIGNKRGLALTYTNRTLVLMRLGLFDEALTSIERSNTLFAIVHEERTVVANHVNASFVKLQLGDPVAAKELARSALTIARAIAFPVFEAAALANLGNAERCLGELGPAIEHMEAGIALRRPIQDARDFVDDLADLTIAYAASGRGRDALETANELCTIGRGSFDGALWPHYISWAVAQGFAVGGDANRSDEFENRARVELEAFAARIEDERIRMAFLSVPINVQIAGRT